MRKSGKEAIEIFGTPAVTTADPVKGRPVVLDAWTRISVILEDKHLKFLDQLGIDFRYKARRSLSRSDIFRSMITLIDELDIEKALDDYGDLGDEAAVDILKNILKQEISGKQK